MNKNGEKDFNGWIKLKTKLHYLGHPIDISEGDVWWCAAGENIQTEINGKSNRFSRPVLVVKKFGRYSFLGSATYYKNTRWQLVCSFWIPR